MPYSIRYTPVGKTASIGSLSLRAALEAAADLEGHGHQDIVILDESGETVSHRELELLVRGNGFPDEG